jgi:hypothetical protein
VLIKWMSFTLLLSALFGATMHAATHAAATCNTSDVQAAINSASEGDTVIIPAGTCTWTSGVTISGKGIAVTGQGSGRIIAISSSTLALGTGSKTLTVIGADPGHMLSISTGQTLTISETGNRSNFMTGTVTSYSSGTLAMNITSSGGTCAISVNPPTNCKRWMISTPSSTVIINNNPTDKALFTATEDTAFHTNISGIRIGAGTNNAHAFEFHYAPGGQAILLHDCWVSGNSNNPSPPSGNATMVFFHTNRGVVWNCSFDSSPFNIASLGAFDVYDPTNVTGNSWTSASNFGMNDSTGQSNVYVEDCDFHAMGFATNTDDNGRAVVRYSLFDNSGMMGTHGADTANWGARYFEAYNNVATFGSYNDGSTFNLNNWFYIRGGTFVIHDNTMPALQSTDYGTKPDVNMTVMNLQRNQGPDPCWGAGTSKGASYHAPRQVGFGYLTGTGKDSLGRTNDSIAYVGDSEPAYIWANSRQPLTNLSISDYGGSACTNPDTSSNYIVAGRDYFNGSAAKPGYTSYTYPHPLTQGSGASGGGTNPSRPTSLQAVVH